MILVGNAAAGTVLHHSFGYMRTAREAMALSESGLIYALVVSALVTFVFRVRDLIGPSLFTSLLLGRYHRPTKEERIFLLVPLQILWKSRDTVPADALQAAIASNCSLSVGAGLNGKRPWRFRII